MFGAIAKRTLLALIPIAILTTAGLALTGVTQFPTKFASTTGEEESALPPDPTHAPTAPAPSKVLVAQSQPATVPPAPAQVSDQTDQTADAEEPLPVLVVDKTALTLALAELDRATEQAKLAVTALSADAQQRYIQETINLLTGTADPAFQRVAQATNGDAYRGVRPLLIEARVVREAAEVQWLAAVQRQIEARARRHAELVAQAGSGTGVTSQPAPASAGDAIASVVGPTGVLGTRGMRPEEQAAELVSRAIRQAVGALGTIANQRQGYVQEGGLDPNNASERASDTMDAVVRMLDTAKKIIQIAADR